MPDIRLTRIDNRLIHGQVATQWCGVVGANLLLVANDAVAADEFRQGLMNMAAPAYAQTRFFTIEKTINIIHKASANQHIAIICESSQDVLKLVEGGVPIKLNYHLNNFSVLSAGVSGTRLISSSTPRSCNFLNVATSSSSTATEVAT